MSCTECCKPQAVCRGDCVCIPTKTLLSSQNVFTFCLAKGRAARHGANAAVAHEHHPPRCARTAPRSPPRGRTARLRTLEQVHYPVSTPCGAHGSGGQRRGDATRRRHTDKPCTGTRCAPNGVLAHACADANKARGARLACARTTLPRAPPTATRTTEEWHRPVTT